MIRSGKGYSLLTAWQVIVIIMEIMGLVGSIWILRLFYKDMIRTLQLLTEDMNQLRQKKKISLEHQFRAEELNQKWLTDIMEFSIKVGKVYLSSMIDCFDGMPVKWTIGTSHNETLVNTMLAEAIATLNPDEKPIVHSDRGCHYR